MQNSNVESNVRSVYVYISTERCLMRERVHRPQTFSFGICMQIENAERIIGVSRYAIVHIVFLEKNESSNGTYTFSSKITIQRTYRNYCIYFPGFAYGCVSLPYPISKQSLISFVEFHFAN